MKKYYWQIILFLVLAALMASCSVSNGYYVATYRVKSLEGDTATFRGIKGKYLVKGKTTKIGQKIHLYKTFDSTKVNVVRIK